MPTVARPLLAALVLSTLVFAASAVADVEDATREIHLQQVQMARFASSACPGCTVVVNDIGAVSLLGDVRIVDSFGLSNREVMRAKLDHAYDRAALAAIADEEQASFAMIYPNWKPGPPPDWERVGSWTVSDTWVLGGPEVVVYSLDPSFTDELREAFVEFDMPPEVLVTVG